MNKYQLPKDEIDVSNPFIKDTFFETVKNSGVSSGNDKVDLELDDLTTFNLLSGKYDLNSSLDRCIVDHDKMKVIYAIQMYNYGGDYEKLFDMIDENKYSYLFIETVLKDNPFTEDIIDHLLNFCDKDNYEPIVDCNGDTPLIWTCENNMKKMALELIDNFDEKCKPEHVNKDRITALIRACDNYMNDVALKIIDNFGEKCNPSQVDDGGNTALIWACGGNKMNDVALKLIDTFGELCKPEQFNSYEYTALFYACENGMIKVSLKLIDTYGKKCKPEHVDDYSKTALILACKKNMNNVALKLIDTFGEECKPDHVDKDSKTALDYANKNSMVYVVSKLKSLLDDP